MKGDKNAVALVEGAPNAYIDNKVASIDGGQPRLINDTLYVPVQFLSKAFGLKIDYINNGETALIHAKGKGKIAISKNNYLTVNNRLVSLRQPVRHQNGHLLVPIQTFVEIVLDKHVSFIHKQSGYEPLYAMYIADHHNQIGDDIARTLKGILNK